VEENNKGRGGRLLPQMTSRGGGEVSPRRPERNPKGFKASISRKRAREVERVMNFTFSNISKLLNPFHISKSFKLVSILLKEIKNC
jgi:hypothetical protein